MILPVIRKNLSILHLKNATFYCLLRLSSSAAPKTLNPSPKSNHMAEYLINSCGLSSQRATAASKVISKVTSIDQANSVRHFFKHHGFDDTRICKLVFNYPGILSANVEKTIQPNLQTLCKFGFTETELQMLITSNPSILVSPVAIPRLEFWQTFVGTNNTKDLVLVFTRNRSLICRRISVIASKITLLKEHGLSDADIIGLAKKGRGFILRNGKSIEALLKRAKEMGFDLKSSSMLSQGLSSLSSITSSALARKMEFFKGFRWSEEEFLAAFRKAPFFIHLKEETIQEKMEFLVGRVGCKQSYIASHPLLLALSLEKRLKPRHYVMEILKTNKLIARELDLFSIMCLSDKNFVKKSILPYKEEVPKMHDIYNAACAGQITL